MLALPFPDWTQELEARPREEDVVQRIGVAGDEVCRRRSEHDNATVHAERKPDEAALRVTLGPGRGYGRAHRRGRASCRAADTRVADKDVGHAICVASHQVGGCGEERDEPS